MNQYWKIIIAVVITALVTGSGVYLWQQNEMLKNNEITLRKELSEQMKNIKPTPSPVEKTNTVTEKKVVEVTNAPNEEKVAAPVEATDRAVLLQDAEYGVAFTTTKNCASYFSVKATAKGGQELKHYDVFVIGAQDWPKNTVWYNYSVFTPKVYNAMDPDELPGRPAMVLKLSSGNFLTRWSPNDGPENPLHCTIEAENI